MNAISISNDIHSNMLDGTIPADTFIPISNLSETLLTLTCKKTKFVSGTDIDLMRAIKELILVDTGANGSFTNNLQWIHGIKYFKTPQKAMVGDGYKCDVLAMGYWILPTSDGRMKPFPVKYSLQLPNVLSCEYGISRLKYLTGYSIHQQPDNNCIQFSTRTPEGAFSFNTIKLDGLPYLKETPVPIRSASHILHGDEQTFAIHADDGDMDYHDAKENLQVWIPEQPYSPFISHIREKKVTFADKVDLFQSVDSQVVDLDHWMSKDWTSQVDILSNTQKVAFIDDDGDEHFYDTSDGETDEQFYDAKDFTTDSKKEEKIKIKQTDGFTKCSGKSKSGKIRLKKILSMAALTLHPLLKSATALTPQHRVNTMSKRAAHALWHNRLTHFNDDAISDLHQHVDGVPKLPAPSENRIKPCPACVTGKSNLADMNGPDLHNIASRPGQSFYMDYGFVNSRVKHRGDEDEQEQIGLVSSQGFKSYLLIKDQFSKYKWVLLTKNKKPPIEQLRIFLRTYGCQLSKDKWIRTDRGGELNGSEAIRKMFHSEFGFTPQSTAAHASVQNGFCEEGHKHIGNRIRTMLWAANLPLKYWDYALVHAIFVTNCIPSGDQKKTPFELFTGSRPNLSRLRTWGCTVYVRDKAVRSNKLDNDTCVGTFLGYSGTTKNAIYLNNETGQIRVGTHVKFDEANQLQKKRPPQAILLSQAFGNDEKDALVTISPKLSEDDIGISLYASDKLLTNMVKIPNGTSTLGLELSEKDGDIIIQDILNDSLLARHLPFYKRFKFTRLLELDGVSIKSLSDCCVAERDIIKRASEDKNGTQFSFKCSFDPSWSFRDIDDGAPTLNLDQFRHVNAILHDDTCPSGICDDDFDDQSVTTIELITDDIPFDDAYQDLDDIQDCQFYNCVQDRVHRITIDESKLTHPKVDIPTGKLNRRKLLQLSDPVVWKGAEQKQLESHHRLKALLKPCRLPRNANLMNFQWAYKLKSDGTPKARCALDGSPRQISRRNLQINKTYSACVDQVANRIFWSISSSLNNIICGIDIVNGYAHAPPPDIPTYLVIDDQYADWYFNKFNEEIDRDLVIPVGKALQGHPEAGASFSKMVNSTLKDMGFTTTVHEPCIYRRQMDGVETILLRQVDDIAISGPSTADCQHVIDTLNDTFDLTVRGILKDTTFNGTDVKQTSKAIKLSCGTYIRKLVKGHEWFKDFNLPTRKVPITNKMASDLITADTCEEKTKESRALEKRFGFKYRQAVGELIYALVVVRADIALAVTTVAQYSTKPGEQHFEAVRTLLAYLLSTPDQGLIFWRTNIRKDLPQTNEEIIKPDYEAEKDPFPQIFSSPYSVTGFVDASHASATRMRSVTGFLFLLGSHLIAYKTKVQAVTSISSTEAELVAACFAGKMALYLRSVLLQLGFPQPKPTLIFEDNAATIAIVNEGRPSPRTRHVKIQTFAVQSWSMEKLILLKKIHGTANPSDGGTKALDFVKFTRHFNRVNGAHGQANFDSITRPQIKTSSFQQICPGLN